ncbi:hypothetical protein ABTY63_16455 [Streptomyces solisilvae]|uniref:hypothetical protein n=1 Tax=Streptomyces malaysiensis TaxID=92644 RepID=UPI00332A885D
MDLEVVEPFSRAEISDGVIPATGAVKDSSGELIGELLLWVSEGSLLPDPHDVTVAVRH